MPNVHAQKATLCQGAQGQVFLGRMTVLAPLVTLKWKCESSLGMVDERRHWC